MSVQLAFIETEWLSYQERTSQKMHISRQRLVLGRMYHIKSVSVLNCSQKLINLSSSHHFILSSQKQATYNIQNRVNQLGALSVMTLGLGIAGG